MLRAQGGSHLEQTPSHPARTSAGCSAPDLMLFGGGTWSCDTPPCSPKSHSHLGKGDGETVPLGPASIPSSQGQQHGAGMPLPILPMEKEGNTPKESTDMHLHTPRGFLAGLGHCRGATPPEITPQHVLVSPAREPGGFGEAAPPPRGVIWAGVLRLAPGSVEMG